MRVVVQRCKYGSVSVDGKIINEIDNGMVLLVGFNVNLLFTYVKSRYSLLDVSWSLLELTYIIGYILCTMSCDVSPVSSIYNV